MKSPVLLAGMAVAAVFVAASAGGKGPDQAYSPRDEGRLSATSAAFDKEGQRLVASFYVAPWNRPGTDWNAFVAEWDLKTGKRTWVAKATAPVLFGEHGRLAMALWERSRERGFRAIPRGRMALWKFGETEPYKVLQRGPGSDDSVLAACFASGDQRLVTISGSHEVIVWELDNDKPPLVLGRVAASGKAIVAYSPGGMESVLAVVSGSEGLHAVVWRFEGSDRRQFKESFRWEGRTLGFPREISLDMNDYLQSSPMVLPLGCFPKIAEAGVRQGFARPAYEARVCETFRNGESVYALGSPPVLIDRDSTRSIPLGGEALAVTRYWNRLAVGAHDGTIRIWNLDEARIEKTLRLDDRPAETFRAAAVGSWARRADPKQIWELLHWLFRLRADVGLLPEGSLNRLGGASGEKTAEVGAGAAPVVSKAAAAGPVGEPVPGPATEALGKWARGAGTFLGAPLVELDRKTGKRYSAVVLFDPHGRQVLHARKRGPFTPDEAAWASDGNLGTPVADTPFGRIGVLAGGDLEAEARAMADMKVDLALHPMHPPATRNAAYLGILKNLAGRHHFAIIAACPLLPVTTDICPAGAIIGRDGKLLPWPSGPRTADDSIFGDLPLPLSDATAGTDRPRNIAMDNNRVTKSNTVRHVMLAVSAPRKVTVGEKVDLTITLTNVGTEKVVFGRVNGYRECGIQVVDSKGKACPFTSFGHQVMGGEKNTFKKFLATPLESGKSHTWEIDLVRCFQLTQGVYTLYCSIELNASTYPFTVPVEGVELDVSASSATSAEIQRRLEDGARTYSHFATGDIVGNRRTRPDRWPPALYEEQTRLLIDLSAWAKHAEAVRSLISHADAKVRTLALGVLFVHEDPQDLPLIASLADDKTPTILDIHDSPNSQPGVRPLREIEKPQTVGDVAQSMLVFYLQAARLERGYRFADYWLPRQGRKTCASWFLARFRRATRLTTPLSPEYHEDVKRVLSEINALFPGERAWTQLYVFCDGPITDFEVLFPEAVCVASLRAVGPDQIVQFLQRKRVTQDPDLWFDDGDRVRTFSLMAHFVLRHAPQLLRAQDAPVLLECEKDPLRSSSGGSEGTFPAWAAAAAELTSQNDPAAGKAIIDAALLRFPLKGICGGEEQAVLIGALFRFAGVTEKQRIIDWIYQAQAKATREKQGWSNHGSVAFLRQVREAKRCDARPLLAAIVADPRFDQTDYWTLEALLKLADADVTEPLVSVREISDAWPLDGDRIRRRPRPSGETF